MNLAVYESIVCSLRKKSWNQDEALRELCEEFPSERMESIRSIIGQEFQKHVKENFKTAHGINKKKVYRKFKKSINEENYEPGMIIKLAEENNTSAALTARSVLEEYLLENEDGSDMELDKIKRDKNRKSKATKILRDTSVLEEGELAYELLLATIQDNNYGPLAEAIKNSRGEEHEQRLKDLLNELNIPFCDEHVLREKGYDKTPDIKLEVPIAVDGYVVNWIESKALFGDPENHAGYLKDQFWSYWNRFGPGLVIYWYGYVAQLDSNRSSGIVLGDHLNPAKIVKFNPSSKQITKPENPPANLTS